MKPEQNQYQINRQLFAVLHVQKPPNSAWNNAMEFNAPQLKPVQTAANRYQPALQSSTQFFTNQDRKNPKTIRKPEAKTTLLSLLNSITNE